MVDTITNPASETPARRLWTRLEYEHAASCGVFRPDERLELIAGEVVKQVSPQNSPHAASIRALERALAEAFGEGFDVRSQLPLALGDDSEPEPDISVAAGSWRDYETAHPTTAVLVVEVSNATLRFDRTTKAKLYSQAGIPEYWILNLNDRVLEVHRTPENAMEPAYRTVSRLLESESVSPIAAPAITVLVSDLLPRRR